MSDNNEKNISAESIIQEMKSNSHGPLELSYLIGAVLDYYQEEEIEEGEEWKGKSMLINKNVPKDLDEEIKKTFIALLKGFQNA